MISLPNILIVDDLEVNLILLDKIIRKIKIIPIRAHSGIEALEKTEGIDLALAILDVRMSGMDGYELAVKINEKRPSQKVPIIFITANHLYDMEEFKGYESGAVDFIYKPINYNILLSKINVFLDLYDQKHKVIRNTKILEKTAEELTNSNIALKQSEEKYKRYVENAPDGVFVFDANGKYMEVNEAACRMSGYSKKELLNMAILDILSEDSLEDGSNNFKNLIQNDSAKADLLFMTKEGSKRWWSVESVKHSENQFLGFTKDITEQKQSETALRENEARMYELNALKDKFFTIIAHDMKSPFSSIIGFGNLLVEQIRKKDYDGIEEYAEIIQSSSKRAMELLMDLLEWSKSQSTLIINTPLLVETKELIDEVSELLNVNAQQNFKASSEDFVPITHVIAYSTVLREISDRNKMQNNLIRTERMVSLGEMASAMAHEINQPLLSISLGIENCFNKILNSESVDINYLKIKSEKIFEDILRIGKIIDHVRVFSRDNNDNIHSLFNINESIESAVSMISEQFKNYAIELTMDLDKNTHPIIGNTYRFEQVVLNMLVNAKDAIDDRAKSSKAEFEKTIQIKTYHDTEANYLEIIDNGKGIDPKDIDHIMLPFYTTKDAGKGTGLGLSVSYGIIKDLNGNIDIISNPNLGTKFKITLPYIDNNRSNKDDYR